jgi:Zn-finger nucleic acid-binding protein
MAACPGCRGELQLTGDSVPIALCARCGGLWLSVPALIARLDDDPTNPVGTLAQALANAPVVAPAAEGSRTCPGCQRPMPTFIVGGVSLEHCARCSGVFLDRGELLALAERFPAPRREDLFAPEGVSPEVAEAFALLVNPWWD